MIICIMPDINSLWEIKLLSEEQKQNCTMKGASFEFVSTCYIVKIN